MHMRLKKWARPELAACPFYVEPRPHGAYGAPGPELAAFRNTWKRRFPNPDAPLHLELGCGKGVSTSRMIADHPEINYLICDLSPGVLGVARRNIIRACGEDVSNVVILLTDIAYIGSLFGEEDLADRIYIHFCNPWTERTRQEKRRLTHPRQLLQYRDLLRPEGEIWFKTDDETLFEDSRVYFDLCGFRCIYLTRNLHASGFQPNYITEHEQRFMEQGIPIRFGIFRMTGEAPSFDPTRFRLTPGLRKATLAKLDAETELDSRMHIE